MEKENINENGVNSEVEEMVSDTSNIETTQVENNIESETLNESNTNSELQGLINGENSDDINESSSIQVILANVLDQLLVVAASAVLVLLCSVVLKLFGYMFTEGTGSVVLAGGIIYFILNCIYAPIMEMSKAKNTVAKKILNIN